MAVYLMVIGIELLYTTIMTIRWQRD